MKKAVEDIFNESIQVKGVALKDNRDKIITAVKT